MSPTSKMTKIKKKQNKKKAKTEGACRLKIKATKMTFFFQRNPALQRANYIVTAG